MKGVWIEYTEAQLRWLKANRKMPIADYHRAFCARFRRKDVSAVNLHSLRKRMGWKTGRTGCFEKGLVPHNKGKKCRAGKGGRHPNARKTQFKKGNLPHNTHYLGHERVSKDGYVEISIDETNPHTGFERRYVLKHRWAWEQAARPGAEGHGAEVQRRPVEHRPVELGADPEGAPASPRRSLRARLRPGAGRTQAHHHGRREARATALRSHARREPARTQIHHASPTIPEGNAMNMHAKITAATATLAQLHPGQEYPGGNINARLTYTDEEIDELAASLKGPDGQLRPLLVATHAKKPGQFFVFGGGRRRIAFERLIASGALPKDHPIEIVSHGDVTPAEALSKSLADNQAVPMHPADQAATFAKLASDRAPEDIAKDRGMTVRAVKQSIALGSALAPEVITAWRAGKLTRELVEAFTIASDFESQVKALNDGMANGYLLRANEIRRALTRNRQPEMKRLLGFVGVEAARAAGIEVTEDFFGDGGNVQDMKGLKKLAKAKMDGVAADLISTGWSWVEADLNEARGHHGYGQVNADPEYTVAEKKRIGEITTALKALQDSEEEHSYFDEMKLERERDAIEEVATFRAFTEKHKKKSGVIVSLAADGAVVCKGGLLRKDEPKAAANKKPGSTMASAPQPPKIPDITREVEESLEDMQGAVLAELIAAKPKEAFAMFLAAIAHCDWNDAVMWNEVHEHADGVIPGKSFADAFAQLRKLPLDKMAAKLALLVGKVANISGYISGDKDATAIVDLIGEKALQGGLAKRFDPKPYVAGASKQHLLGILAETQGEEGRKAHEQDGEAKLALPVIQGIKASGWLPPMLRTRLYAGPSQKKPAKKKAR
jgi:ParB-like chromosome segregation protein Spo0J